MTDAHGLLGSPPVDTVEIGGVQVTRVVEWHGQIAPANEVFPSSTPRSWDTHRGWLEPDYRDPVSGYFRAVVQTWVLYSHGRTILIDTGLGDHKERPYMPAWSHLETGFLGRLRAVGIEPGDVDLVVNTHVHADHVGWNTRLVDGQWVPTFPNADYLIPDADYAYWNPLNGYLKRGSLGGIGAALGNQNMFEDSVRPVHEHGQAVLWSDRYPIDSALTLEAHPGHTPGSAVLSLDSKGERALFVGDLLHSPLQIVEPEHESCLSEDPAAAVVQRRRMLERAADHKALVFPAHLPGSGAAEVQRDGSAFRVSRWAPFAAT